jgi:large conductance mechanosensitive channel
MFVNTIIDFVIVAFVIFMIVKQMNKLKKPEAAPAATTKDCNYCLMSIPIKATKCGHCSSDVRAA